MCVYIKYIILSQSSIICKPYGLAIRYIITVCSQEHIDVVSHKNVINLDIEYDINLKLKK